MNNMPSAPKRLAAAIATVGVLAIGAPGAGAATGGFQVPSGFSGWGGFVPGGFPAADNGIAGAFGPCSRPSAEGQGGTGAADHQVCQGAGLSFIGPAIGQIATVIGPTIIGPAANLNVVVSAGAVAQ
jgi:hypothetical protein